MSKVAKQLAEAKRVTVRLMAEAGTARQSWALFEGLNGRDDQHRAVLVEGAMSLGLQRPLNGLVNALTRDTLLTLLRMTDPPGDDKLTLCRLSKLLSNQELIEERIADARDWIPGSPGELADQDAATCASAIKFITDLVPPLWGKSAPTDPRLFNLRSKLRPVRDKVLAHSIDTTEVIMPVVEDMRQFLDLGGKLVSKAQLVFRGSWMSEQADFGSRLIEATELWDRAQMGFANRGSGGDP